MNDRLSTRFEDWLGVWRGPGRRFDGSPAMMDMAFTEVFAGRALHARALLSDMETGRTLSRSLAFWSLDRDGAVVCAQFSDAFGHALLHELPDDPDVLSLAGPLPGNVEFGVTLRRVDDYLEVNSRASEGYMPDDRTVRITAKLYRTTEASR